MKRSRNFKMLQRGDGGIGYVIFIMGIIIAASFVMVGGLTPTFDDSSTSASGGTQEGWENGFGGLPSLPPKGSQEWIQGVECAKKLVQKYGKGRNSTFSKKDQPEVAPPECLQ